MKTKYYQLTPQYMKNFKCIGSTCEDTCCSGWNIPIDEKTYKKYKKIKNLKYKKLISSSIKRVKSVTNGTIEKIVIEKDCSCPFLNEDKLCNIQLDFGENYLSNTCKKYPRINNVVDLNIEQSGSMSCPEIARLALLNKNPMEFDQLEICAQLTTYDKKIKTENSLNHYFWNLRIFTIEVLQKRKYNLYERLFILGIFYEALTKIIQLGNYDNISSLIDTYRLLLNNGEQVKKELSNFEVDTNQKYKIIKDIILPDDTGVNSKRFLECLNEAMAYFESNNNNEINNIDKKYLNAYENYLKIFIQKEEYLFENYLVNHVFNSLFPYDLKNVYDSYIMLVIRFSLIKVILVGMAGFQKELTIDQTLKLIQSFSKTLEHNNLYIEKILEYLKKHNITSLTFMVTLFKN